MPACCADPSSTVQEALRWATGELGAVADRPRVEAEILLASLLGRGRAYLLAHPEATVGDEVAVAFSARVRRRAEGEPLPYLTGRMEFFGLEFAVTPDVLIPRPETELLVEEALSWLERRPGARAVDVGTGSGCIAVTLALHAPHLRVCAVDLSTAALTVARDNARRHGVADRLLFLQGDLLQPLRGPFDLVVSNPPYVATTEWDSLPPSVRREPRLALLAGSDGLDALRRLLPQAAACLRADGLLLVEMGERQGEVVASLARRCFPQADVAILSDLAGKERLLRVQRF